MNATPYGHSLLMRLKQVSMTLEYLQQQLAEVHDNREWMDAKAYVQRVNLLENVTGWYLEEQGQIESALTGLKRPTRGFYDSSGPAAYSHSRQDR